MQINSGGLTASDGGITASNSAGLGLTVTEGGASITNTASNAASLDVSATSADFINTVASVQGQATDSTGYNLLEALHNGVTKFSVRGDGNTHIESTSLSSTTSEGALVVEGGVGIGENLNVGGTISDGTMSIASGGISGVTSLDVSGTILGDTLTDGTFTASLGDISGVTDLTMSGTLSADIISATSNIESQIGFSVSGTQVLSSQQSAIAQADFSFDPGDGAIGSMVASGTYDDVQIQDLIDHTERLRDWVDELTTKLNLALNALEAHGLIAT